jgi:hypothetical protein
MNIDVKYYQRRNARETKYDNRSNIIDVVNFNGNGTAHAIIVAQDE